MISSIFSHCIHDKIQRNTTFMTSNLDENFILKIKSDLNSKNLIEKKKFEQEIYEPIRIQFVTTTILNDNKEFFCKSKGDKFKTGIPENDQKLCKSRIPGDFENCWDNCQKEDILSLEDSEYIERILLKLSNFVSNLIKVIPVSTPFCFGDSYCGRAGVQIPDSDKCGNGSISKTDIQVYITSRPTPEQVLAFSTFCAVSTGLERPIAAWINIAPNLLDKTKFTEEMMLSILKHGNLKII